MRWITAAILLAAHPARAAGPSRLTVVSTGREVEVEARVDGQRRSCRTPCSLELPPGARRLRVEGVGRRVFLDPGENSVTVRPARLAVRNLGLVLAVLGGVGLGLASVPEDAVDGIRLCSALGGLALMGLSVPLLTSSSTKVLSGRAPPQIKKKRRSREWGRLELRAGASYLARSSAVDPGWGLAVGAGTFVVPDRLSLDVRGIVESGPDGFGDRYQLLAGARGHLRVPLAMLFVGGGLGYGSESMLLEARTGLRLAVSRWIAPQVTLSYQASRDEQWGHHLRVGAGLAASF